MGRESKVWCREKQGILAVSEIEGDEGGFRVYKFLGKLWGLGIAVMKLGEVEFLDLSDGKGCKARKHVPSLKMHSKG